MIAEPWGMGVYLEHSWGGTYFQENSFIQGAAAILGVIFFIIGLALYFPITKFVIRSIKRLVGEITREEATAGVGDAESSMDKNL